MKFLTAVVAAWLVGSAAAAAQEPSRKPITRADAHVVLGWQNLHKPQESEGFGSDDWLNAIFYGAPGPAGTGPTISRRRSISARARAQSSTAIGRRRSGPSRRTRSREH